MLCHGADALPSPAIGSTRSGLQAVAVEPGQIGHLVGMGAEGVLKAHPAGFGGKVDLRGESSGDAQCPVFLRDGLTELPAHLRGEGGGNTQPFGPLGYIVGTALELGLCLGSAVPGVTGHIHRNAPGQFFRCLLDSIAPSGGNAGALQFHHQHMADVVLFQEGLLLVGERPSLQAALGEGLAVVAALEGITWQSGDHLMGRIHHQSGNLLDAQTGSEILRPGLGRQTPVLIGEQLSGAGQILEEQAVLFQDRSGNGPEDRAIGILIEPERILRHRLCSSFWGG